MRLLYSRKKLQPLCHSLPRVCTAQHGERETLVAPLAKLGLPGAQQIGWHDDQNTRCLTRGDERLDECDHLRAQRNEKKVVPSRVAILRVARPGG